MISTIIKSNMTVIKLEVEEGEGTDNTPIEIPKISSHTIVLITYLPGVTDTTIFIHLPEDAVAGDLYEIMSLGTKVAITNSNVYGIAVAESKRSFLSVRKILVTTETTDNTWIGYQSLPPSWI